MAPKLYMTPSSAVVRAVLLTEAALGLNLEHVEVDLSKREHLTPEFEKMNPAHSLPTLVDDGKVIFDSAAINIYLVEKYGQGSPLYPKDPYEKALVHQTLHFASGQLFPATRQVIRPIMLEGAKEMCPNGVKVVNDTYGMLENMLGGKAWFTGDKMTIADLGILPILTSTDHPGIMPVDENKFPNLKAWLGRCKKLPFYGCNEKGNEMFIQIFLHNLHSK
ncbi:hypothetical protein FQR65_LT05829 [Abscondita terminalis]|nr:hypothetical protein FQR65_LT05829 [Abscondita terminalis]